MITVDSLNAEHGLIVSPDGTISVIPGKVSVALQTATVLRREAAEADREAALSRSKGLRRFMLQAARRCRYRAELIERQCDAIKHGVRR